MFQKTCHSFDFIIFNCVYMCLLCGSVCVFMQTGEVRPLELALQVIVSYLMCVLGIELWASGRAGHALNY